MITAYAGFKISLAIVAFILLGGALNDFDDWWNGDGPDGHA